MGNGSGKQLSLFGSSVQDKHEDFSAFAAVMIDIPTRSLPDPFTYGIPAALACEARLGSTVVVEFGHRFVLGYVVDLWASSEGDTNSAKASSAHIRALQEVLPDSEISEVALRLARWMAHEYVASLPECLRLFLPPGGTPQVKPNGIGGYVLERPKVAPSLARWVSLTKKGHDYTPPTRAYRQKQVLAALACGTLSMQELSALQGDVSQVIRTLEHRGIVQVETRRMWRGAAFTTSLSSAQAQVPSVLTRGQQNALQAIARACDAAQGDVVLVDGVTGSGKTEVYLRAIERVLAQGKSACVLVPEISLTAQTVGRFRSRFGDAVAVFHSRLSVGERFDQWEMVRSGAAKVVVGARSALFCPQKNLGLIIVDEEHEQSYKQGSSPRYHAREVAAHLACITGSALVLGSATPSAEARWRAACGEYGGARWERVEMPERPGGACLPEILIADLRREFTAGNRTLFSRELRDALISVVQRQEKAVLLHNRRGFAPFLMCRECGCVPTCTHCSTALTYHEHTQTLQCHTCGAIHHVKPYPAPGSCCPSCSSRYLAKMGAGTQQVEDAVRELVGDDAEVIRMDADSTRGKDGHRKLLEQFDAASSAVLVGTQMIAKGLDFPEVTLVGVINADVNLKMPDFRASERSYDLLEQVAGRAGRGVRPGQVIIQTYFPEHPVIRAVAEHNRELFSCTDDLQRKEAFYPPYSRLCNVVVRSKNLQQAQRYMARLADALQEGLERLKISLQQDVAEILGPTTCVIERAKDFHRLHVLIKYSHTTDISSVLQQALTCIGSERGVQVSIDIDAYDLL